jgi:hypothetical protein
MGAYVLHATIAGGAFNNMANSDTATSIGGGRDNSILTGILAATIPGGDSLIANSYAQTVVGYNNMQTGQITKGTLHAGIDTALFIVGNGNTSSLANRSNAFEVSYDGHSVVSDNNGTGGAVTFPAPSGRADIYGGAYQDNTIIAWGQVPAGTLVVGPLVVVNTSSDFGVLKVIHTALGQYDVTLNIKNPDCAVCPRSLAFSSIVATLVANPISPPCNLTISTTQMGAGNTFTVFIRSNSDCLGPGVNSDFTFQVVGR